MTLNDIYLLSQVLAVFALVASVIYLALQVRQNTLQARANATYQFLEANGNINIAVIENKQVAGREDSYSLGKLLDLQGTEK